MSTQVDLTIIAIAVGVMAIVMIVILLMLTKLLVRLFTLERSVTQELKVLSADVRELVQNVRNTSDRVSDAVGSVSRTAAWVGRLVTMIASGTRGRNQERVPKLSTSVPDPAWWLTGLKWGWSLVSKRQKRKREKSGSGPSQSA
ncbi:MAG: hypothetical protein M1600_12695 [Firmicutes bacterium]|jgi:hypothetical protein|nr:hypothetical protein [Bacillota bacterium]